MNSLKHSKNTLKSWLAFDVGERRVGVALADSDVKIARPLKTLANDENLKPDINKLIGEFKPILLVVGLPRGLDGQETAQTSVCRQFADNLKIETGLDVYLMDEALTSHKARDILETTQKAYTKEDIDALAAAIILQDYIDEKIS